MFTRSTSLTKNTYIVHIGISRKQPKPDSQPRGASNRLCVQVLK